MVRNFSKIIALCLTAAAFCGAQVPQPSPQQPASSGGGGIGGFPKVVAAVNYTAQSGDLSFNLLADPVTGDYTLNDVFAITTTDASTTYNYQVNWADDNAGGGIFGAFGPYTSPNGSGSTSQNNPFGAFGVGPGTGIVPGLEATAPTVFHAITGTPIAVAITVTPSAAATARPSAGSYGGTGYAPGDTGTFSAGDGAAAYTVSTVDGSGGVLTFTATGGTTYPDLGSSASTVVTGAGDGNFHAILTAAAGVVSSGTVETYGGFGYAIGDTGTIGSGGATYSVLTIGAGGAVLTVSVTSGGSGYTVSTGNATAVTTGIGDGTLQLDILTLSTALQYSYHATLVRNQ